MRAVSNLMGLLIVIAIVVGAFVGVGAIISSVMQRSGPRAVDLVVGSGGAVLSGGTLVVNLMVTPVGVEPVSITSVKVYKIMEIEYSSSKIYSSIQLNPGHSYEIIAVFYGVRGVSIGDTLAIIVEWRGVETGTTGASRYHVRVTSR